MAYEASDPRSAMSTKSIQQPDVAVTGFVDFAIVPPVERTSVGSVSWIARGQNAVIRHTRGVAGDVVYAQTSVFEQMLLTMGNTHVIIETSDGRADVRGEAVVVVPPGHATIRSVNGGELTQVFQHDEPGWAARASNADEHVERNPRVAPLEPWPAAANGERLRVYRLAEVPSDPHRFGRIFRSRAFMVNFFEPHNGPRSPKQLSPHAHNDFEQYSLVVGGNYIHHLQSPWGADSTAWISERHVLAVAPSLAIIPPQTVHTSQALGWAGNQLIDIFAGPRHDFSAQPGWVLNADDYPTPSA